MESEHKAKKKKEFGTHVAWWQEEKPKTPLSERLTQLLEKEDPAFVDEMIKFALLFSSDYEWNEEKKQYVYLRVRSRERDGSWLWTLYMSHHPFARQALHQILQHLDRHEFDRLEFRSTQRAYWRGDYTFWSGKYHAYTLTKLNRIFFRYMKAIYKLAEQRGDWETWAILARRFDVEKGFREYRWDNWNDRGWQTLYSPKTHHYLRRRTWRTLRQLGEKDHSAYIQAATQLLLQYGTEDWKCRARNLKQVNENNFTHLWPFNHVLYHNSTRFTYHGNQTWRASADAYTDSFRDVREEAFPELWDQHPEQLWRLFQEAQAEPVIYFAGRALRLGNPQFLTEIATERFHELLKSQSPQRRSFAASMLLARMDANQPDFKLWLSLMLSTYVDIRTEARRFVQNNVHLWSVEQQLDLFDIFLQKLQSDGLFPLRGEITTEWVEMIHTSFQAILPQLATTDLVNTLVKIDHPAIQELVATILSQTTFTQAEQLLPFLQSEHTGIRDTARSLLCTHFTRLQITPQFLVELITIPTEENQVFTTQFLTDRILWIVPYLEQLTPQLWSKMLRPDTPELVSTYIRDHLLGSLLISELGTTPLDDVLALLNSDNTGMQEFGARLLQMVNPRPEELTVAQLLALAHNKIALARTTVRNLIIQIHEQITDDAWVNLVETDWDDTRNWGFAYLNTLSTVTPDLIYGLLDSARTDIQQFAMKLVSIHRQQLDLHELVYRMSESTDLYVQEQALHLLNELDWSPSVVERLDLFFRTILFRVNTGRKAKQMALQFLLQRGTESEEFAQTIAPILGDFLHNGGKQDFEQVIFTLTQMQRKYPSLQTALKLA